MKLNAALRITGLVIFLEIITARPAGADQVKYLALPEQALAAFSGIIDSAKTSIDLATFIFQPCHPSTQLLMEKLERKAKAGVQVRVLLDSIQLSASFNQNLADDFARRGIEFRIYNKWLLKANLRLHIKMTIVDGQAYIMGGRNYSDSYFGLSELYNYVDRDVLVNGPSAKIASDGFQRLWDSKLAADLGGDPKGYMPWKDMCDRDMSARMSQIDRYLSDQGAQALASAPTRSCPTVRLGIDDPHFADESFGPGWEDGKSAETFMTKARLTKKRATKETIDFIGQTRLGLIVENWIYLPITQLSAAISSVRDRGLPIHVLTNRDLDEGGPLFKETIEYAMDTFKERDATARQRIDMVYSRGALHVGHVLTPPGAPSYLHGKAFVRDAKDVMVGSFNLDSRSANINLEDVVVFPDCPALAQDVTTGFKELKAAHAQDAASGVVPERPIASFLARFLASMLIYQF